MRLSFDELNRFRIEHSSKYQKEIESLEAQLYNSDDNFIRLQLKNQDMASAIDGIDMRLEGIKGRLEADGLSVAKYVFGEVEK